MVKVDLSIESFSSLVGGLYVTYREIDIITVPPFFWQQLTYALIPYLENWRYDILSFEEWLKHYLIITVEDVLTESELEEMRNYSVFVRAEIGNLVLIGAGDIIWEDSTNTSEREKIVDMK